MWQKAGKMFVTNKEYMLIAIQIGLILLLFHPNMTYEVTSFSDRVMGNGLMQGVDITKRVNSFYIVLFVLLPIVTILVNRFLNKWIMGASAKTIKFMNQIALLGIMNTIFALTNQLQGSTSLVITTLLLLGINVVFILTIILANEQKQQYSFEKVQWSCIGAIPIAFFYTTFLHFLNLSMGNEYAWFVAYFLGVVILLIMSHLKKVNIKVLKKSYMVFLMAPVLELIYLELYHVLNQYYIILPQKSVTIIGIYMSCIIISMLYYAINQKRTIKFQYKKYYYPIIIVLFASMVAMLPMTTTVNTDFFESANHGMGVYEFFKYGKIPLLETFDAHMFGNQFFGILYGICNADSNGAIFCLYHSYKAVIFTILLYVFLKKIVPKDTAFLMVLLFPLELDRGLGHYYMAIVAIMAFLHAIKTKTFRSYLWYWISLVFLCIWQLDIGFSIAIATLITMLYVMYKNKNDRKIKNIIGSLFLVIGSFFTIFVILCIMKQINPLTRMLEFMKIASSNLNWGYATLGNSSKFAYAFCYYIAPMVVVATFIHILNRSKGKQNTKILILIALATFYMANIQRGMVRHSLAEDTVATILSFLPLYVAIFMMQHKKKKLETFMISYAMIILFTNFVLNGQLPKVANIFEKAIEKYETFEIQDKCYNNKTKRVQISEQMSKEYQNLKQVMDAILEDNETYLDLSNQTLLYALLDKEKPVYVNQSPGLLSGEQTQQFFINEIQNCKKEVPLVLKARKKELSTQLDEIDNDYRYYLVSEFVSKNYIPLVSVDGYDILVKKEKYQEKLKKLELVRMNEIEILTNESYRDKTVSVFNLKQIPFIWGKYDENKEQVFLQKVASNQTIKQEEISFPINIKLEDKQQGNVLSLEIDSILNTEAKITLYKEKEEIGKYNFTIKQGKHSYTIRISALYTWYTENSNRLTIKAKDEIQILTMQIQKANVIKDNIR